MADVPPELEVQRLDSAAEPGGSTRWRGRAERWLFLQSRWSRWWVENSVDLGCRITGDVDLIYVWMQPYDSAEAGAALSQRLGRPWVADLGDPWALDEMMVYPSALHRRRDLARMGALLGSAAAIVMSTPEAVHRLLARFPQLADRPVLAIPNGFAAEDFAGDPPARTDDTFRIVHTGYLHTELGLQQRRSRPLRRALRGSVRGPRHPRRGRTCIWSRRSTGCSTATPRSWARSSFTWRVCRPRPTVTSQRAVRWPDCTAMSHTPSRSS